MTDMSAFKAKIKKLDPRTLKETLAALNNDKNVPIEAVWAVFDELVSRGACPAELEKMLDLAA